jgi:GTP pyrophosphokinase
MKLSARFDDALKYATQLHAKQVRKFGGVPYVAHLLGVASIALDYGADEDEAIAALLHDAIEDQGGSATAEVIRQRFGETVTTIVEGCTDTYTVPKGPWQERKDAFLARLIHASPSIRLVVAADTLHNVRSSLRGYRCEGGDFWERLQGGGRLNLWYYREIVDVLKRSGTSPLLEELDRTVRELAAIAEQR